jgi:hypothetical protein
MRSGASCQGELEVVEGIEATVELSGDKARANRIDGLVR